MRCAYALALLLALPATLLAQAPRPGMRLTVTRVAPMGGYTASALLVVHTTTIVRTPAPECGALANRITAEGHATGRIRSARIVVIAGGEDRDVAIGVGACDAQVTLTLDDGSVVTPQHGHARTHLAGTSGLDATLEATETSGEGVSTTVSGHIVLSTLP